MEHAGIGAAGPQPGDHRRQAVELPGSVGGVGPGTVGHGQMGPGAGQPQRRARPDGGGQRRHLPGIGADPVHAGVDLEVDAEGGGAAGAATG